ncbi:DUF835 domain-containing protein [Thermococcus sp.]
METNSKDPKEIMEKVIERLKKASPKELLSYAIRNEVEEAKYYARLASRAKRLSVKALFLKMSEESREHEAALRDLFRKLFPGEKPLIVELPPVEVAPLYPKFASVEDYITALEYCMESELFAKRTYELLGEVAENKEVRELALSLAAMEEEHYQEIKKVYELIKAMSEKNIAPSNIRPGGYLFTDNVKAKYFLIDIVSRGFPLKALIRENPEKFLEGLSGNVEVVWITKTKGKNSVSPSELSSMSGELLKFLEENSERGSVLFLQNLGYIALELGFREMMDFLLYLKDSAVLHNGYLIATAVPEAFDKKEWAILTSELELIS